jgi:hypothetical protein
MRLHTRFDRWTALLLATLGCAPLASCGGREINSEDTGAGGSGGSGGDGATDGGGGTAGNGGGIVTAGRGGAGGGLPPPTPGRPFLVNGAPRLASVCPTGEWQAANLALRTAHLDAVQRRRLSQAWTEVAQVEHASIAAFARFTLQLLALGAPASLVEAANAAMADETTHARLAFAVASAYAGRALGAGALSIDGSLEATSLRDVVVATIREGCVGETMSAIQATETLSYVTDPALRDVLAAIAEDETRHAALAWQFVKWAIEHGDEEVRRAARAEFARVAGETDRSSSSPLDARELELLAGGAMPERLAEHIRAQCVRRVVLPCAEALLEGRSGVVAQKPAIGVPAGLP